MCCSPRQFAADYKSKPACLTFLAQELDDELGATLINFANQSMECFSLLYSLSLSLSLIHHPNIN